MLPTPVHPPPSINPLVSKLKEVQGNRIQFPRIGESSDSRDGKWWSWWWWGMVSYPCTVHQHRNEACAWLGWGGGEKRLNGLGQLQNTAFPSKTQKCRVREGLQLFTTSSRMSQSSRHWGNSLFQPPPPPHLTYPPANQDYLQTSQTCPTPTLQTGLLRRTCLSQHL